MYAILLAIYMHVTRAKHVLKKMQKWYTKIYRQIFHACMSNLHAGVRVMEDPAFTVVH